MCRHTTACQFLKLVFKVGNTLKCEPHDLVLCTILFHRTSSIIVLFTDKTDKYDFSWVPLWSSTSVLLEFSQKQNFRGFLGEGSTILLINHFWLFLEHFRFSVFQENNYRKSMRADAEMKQILKSKFIIVQQISFKIFIK